MRRSDTPPVQRRSWRSTRIRGRFDAVVTDESMPGTSGSELIRKIRQIRP